MVLQKSKVFKKSQRGRRISQELKTKIVNEYKRGGVTMAQLHRKHGVCERSISNWVVAAGASRIGRRKPHQHDKKGFIEVKVASGEVQIQNREKQVSISFKSGMELNFDTGTSTAYVANLVKVLGY